MSDYMNSFLFPNHIVDNLINNVTHAELVAFLKYYRSTPRECSCGYCDGSTKGSRCLIGKFFDEEESVDRYCPPTVKKYKKRKISRSLSKFVYERDKYRCVSCGSYIDLTCDHIIPESKGGETSFDNLQTMCRSCNSKKGVKTQ